MVNKSLAPLRRFATCFLVTRLLEASWIIVVLSAALALEHASNSPAPDRWKNWTVLGTGYVGLIAIAWYYLGFGYILVSAIANCVARYTWTGLSGGRYAALNVGVFCVHSVLVIVLVFSGQLTLAIWTAWFATVLYNALVPIWLWRLLVLSRRSGS
jgi:hypothetical protein